MDVVVDGLLHDVNTLTSEHACNLAGRPVLILYHAVNTPPYVLRLAVIAFKAVLAGFALGLCILPHIRAVWLGVSPDFTDDR